MHNPQGLIPIGSDANAFRSIVAAGENRRNTAELIERLAAVEASLAAARDGHLRASAAAVAQQRLANAMVAELTAEEAGKPSARRLTDPRAREARVSFLVGEEAAELARLSQGRLRLSAERINSIKTKKPRS